MSGHVSGVQERFRRDAVYIHCYAHRHNLVLVDCVHNVQAASEWTWKEGPLELLRFMTKSNLGNSSPNVLKMLRNFPSIAVSFATCGRSFSK